MNISCIEGDSGACFSTCEFAYDNMQYPKITDRILLELICLYSFYNDEFYWGDINFRNIDELKEFVLDEFLSIYTSKFKADVIQRIQYLFKEQE